MDTRSGIGYTTIVAISDSLQAVWCGLGAAPTALMAEHYQLYIWRLGRHTTEPPDHERIYGTAREAWQMRVEVGARDYGWTALTLCRKVGCWERRCERCGDCHTDVVLRWATQFRRTVPLCPP